MKIWFVSWLITIAHFLMRGSPRVVGLTFDKTHIEFGYQVDEDTIMSFLDMRLTAHVRSQFKTMVNKI